MFSRQKAPDFQAAEEQVQYPRPAYKHTMHNTVIKLNFIGAHVNLTAEMSIQIVLLNAESYFMWQMRCYYFVTPDIHYNIQIFESSVF